MCIDGEVPVIVDTLSEAACVFVKYELGGFCVLEFWGVFRDIQ